MTVKGKQEKAEIQSWGEVPDFSTESEEDAFWGTHRLSDALLAEMVSGPGDPDLPAPRDRGRAQPISVRLDADLLHRLKIIARRRNVGYQTLLKQWLSERLAVEEDRGGPPRDSAHNPGATSNVDTTGSSEWTAATEEIASVVALLSRELADLVRIASVAPIAPNAVRDAVQNYRQTWERDLRSAEDELRAVVSRVNATACNGD
jgi:hypothetical protein